MENDLMFWICVHEAGHATVALFNHQKLSYVIASRSDKHSITRLDAEEMHARIFGPITLAGYAAEALVAKVCHPVNGFQNWKREALRRCHSDRKEFFSLVEARDLNEQQRLTLWEEAALEMQLLIQQNFDLFQRIRLHLHLYGFAGRETLHEIVLGREISQAGMLAGFHQIEKAKCDLGAIHPSHIPN